MGPKNGLSKGRNLENMGDLCHDYVVYRGSPPIPQRSFSPHGILVYIPQHLRVSIGDVGLNLLDVAAILELPAGGKEVHASHDLSTEDMAYEHDPASGDVIDVEQTPF